VAGMLAKLDVWTDAEIASLETFSREEMSNWRKIQVGQIRVAM
jgi:L-asparaginase II